MQIVRCRSCGLQWLENDLLPSSHYEEAAPALSTAKVERRLRNCRDRSALLRRFVPRHAAVCDIGTGEGLFLQALVERGSTAVWGIEPGAAHVAFARARGLDVCRGVLEDFPSLLRDHRTEVVTLFHVIEHLRDPFAALAMLHASLPPGGFLMLETPDLCGFSARTLGDDWPLLYPEHRWYFTAEHLRRACEEAGFHILGSGKRDFDQHHLGIGECLVRLGLRRPRRGIPHPSAGQTCCSHSSSAAVPILSPGNVPSILRQTIDRFLSAIVVGIGRLDYLWIVAEKPASGVVWIHRAR